MDITQRSFVDSVLAFVSSLIASTAHSFHLLNHRQLKRWIMLWNPRPGHTPSMEYVPPSCMKLCMYVRSPTFSTPTYFMNGVCALVFRKQTSRIRRILNNRCTRLVSWGVPIKGLQDSLLSKTSGVKEGCHYPYWFCRRMDSLNWDYDRGW